jgi:hypothetical protein
LPVSAIADEVMQNIPFGIEETQITVSLLRFSPKFKSIASLVGQFEFIQSRLQVYGVGIENLDIPEEYNRD